MISHYENVKDRPPTGVSLFLVDGPANAWLFSVFTQNRFLAFVLPNFNRSR